MSIGGFRFLDWQIAQSRIYIVSLYEKSFCFTKVDSVKQKLFCSMPLPADRIGT